MKACSGRGGTAPLTLTSALDGGEWSTSLPDSFSPGKEIQYHYIGGFLGPKARMKVLAKRKISYQ